MKITQTALFIFACLILNSCGKKASDYDHLINEYKDIICISKDTNATMTQKTEALQRQLSLQNEYINALKDLSNEEKATFMLNWSSALAKANDDYCD